MNPTSRDLGFDDLLALDGVTLVVNPEALHWVKFVAIGVAASRERPHGLAYSLTLHAADGERLVGFDNAHKVATGTGPARRTQPAHDHMHRFKSIAPYDYRDAATLLADFWTQVDAVLTARGVAT